MSDDRDLARPQLRAFFDGDEERRHQRHDNAGREKVGEPDEPYFGVYVQELRTDWTDGEYDYWDGQCLEYTTVFGRDTYAKFIRLEDAQAFAHAAWADRKRLATMHTMKHADVIAVCDHQGNYYDVLPLLKIVPAPRKSRRFGMRWLLRLLGW